MEEEDTNKWEDPNNNDILVNVFNKFDIFELTSGLGHICPSWRNAVCDPYLWRTLDLSLFKSNYTYINNKPHVYVAKSSDKQLTKLLKISLNLSRQCVTTLIFHYYSYVNDAQLTYIAERSPNLKRLVLPSWDRITVTGIRNSITMWKDLESLAIATVPNPTYLMKQISINCKKFSQLKIIGPCDIAFVKTLIRCVPNLKVLSLRCSRLHMDALLLILNRLDNLQVLNIAHCYIVEGPTAPSTSSLKVVEKLDDEIMEKGSRLRNFITCRDDMCTECQRTKADKGIMRWCRIEQGLWKEDEVKSLAV
ncbi:F-box/LRR-repeat protein At3g48880-like [Rutidosis leptorrhynchoides]|uniref:F-box/LRR-repeat protein At3g48880-like n=1 Tax=Rutidosis leptorrhynchoides TaxID=125765 RepID=UPI003A999437